MKTRRRHDARNIDELKTDELLRKTGGRPLRLMVVLSLLAVTALQACAGILDVFPDGTGIYQNIQQAIQAAQPGDSIRLADGVFMGPGNRNLELAGNLTLYSASGDPAACVLNIEGDGRGFFIHSFPGTTIRIEALTLRGGDPRSLPDEEMSGFGGALAIQGVAPAGSVHIERCMMRDNLAEAGGAAFVFQGRADFVGCVFRDNVATDGAGAYCGQCNAGTGVRFSFCVFHGNDYPDPGVGGYGAGVYYSHSLGRVENCTLANNRAWLGGGLLISTESDVEVEACVIAFSEEGQGLALHAGEVEIARSDIYGNAGGDWVGAIANRLGVDCNFAADPLFCDSSDGDYSLRDDSPCLPENSSGCGLVGASLSGCGVGVAVTEGTDGPVVGLRFDACRPNPFNARAEVRFEIPAAGRTTLAVYDARGRLVATLADAELPPGPHSVLWNGRDASGLESASGPYFVRLEAGGEVVTRKILLLR